MKKTIISVCEMMLMVALISCQASKPALDNQQILPVAQNQCALDSTSNIHIRVNIEPAIASTPQDVYLYTHYDSNTYLLDSIRTAGSTTLELKGYIPFQNKVMLTFEKRGAREISLILSPGDSISFDAPAESEIAFKNEVDIPQLSAQTEWNRYLHQNRILRSKRDSLISLIVHTPKADTLRLQALQLQFDTDSLAIHDMYAGLANSDNPFLVDHSLIFLNIDYHEDYLYKDTLLKKFPDYRPFRLHYGLEASAMETPESKRIYAKMQKIKKDRASVIRFSNDTKKQNIKTGKKLDINLHRMNGETQSLGKFRGKYVLVDFWASWCKPCIDNMRPLIALQKKYANDFEVCAITLDKLPGAWKRRIESIGMQNFNHFIGVDFNTGKIYPDIETLGFKSIPQNYLLDREGKVIAINIYGEELVKKLEELIK